MYGAQIMLADGSVLTSDYVLCTFSLGVLQHTDVRFEPPLPIWKREAIHSMTMVTIAYVAMICAEAAESRLGHVHEDLPAVPREVLV